ncbi:hypothetical protein B0H16DRAFT_1452880 [Mycena metata]|uniref:Uncharacterized protein n=1 Tax=Mycena metata TaxID=1033252 RepID=A0AAD7JT51_9AGAR|nr:hypothetical protein B0H16DRAFT_1452880 [Mycena metata]
MGPSTSTPLAVFRDRCGLEIFDCTTADLSTSESRRDKFRERIGYVKNADGKSEYKALNVDLLHKDTMAHSTSKRSEDNRQTDFRDGQVSYPRLVADQLSVGSVAGSEILGDLEKYIKYLQKGLCPSSVNAAPCRPHVKPQVPVSASLDLATLLLETVDGLS